MTGTYSQHFFRSAVIDGQRNVSRGNADGSHDIRSLHRQLGFILCMLRIGWSKASGIGSKSSVVRPGRFHQRIILRRIQILHSIRIVGHGMRSHVVVPPVCHCRIGQQSKPHHKYDDNDNRRQVFSYKLQVNIPFSKAWKTRKAFLAFQTEGETSFSLKTRFRRRD